MKIRYAVRKAPSRLVTHELKAKVVGMVMRGQSLVVQVDIYTARHRRAKKMVKK